MKPFIVAALAFAAIVGCPAVAAAQPAGWDVNAYIACTDQVITPFVGGEFTPKGRMDDAALQNAYRTCCDVARGAYIPQPEGSGFTCVAPAADPA
ncbi:hypothetical protein ACN27E_08215 [Mycobacterium sp. WMMD1722]|uniref:hypothetical protein n=1 Tax=Mycobacterium sp. WMMD1722 TaxID=3404117 RepID=UPI003BF588E2